MLEQESYKDNMDFVSRAVAYNAYLVDSIRPDLGDRVLDIGCGIGNTTRLLDRPFVVGMDVSDYYIDEFKKRLPDIVPNWKFFKEKAYDLRHKLVHGISSTPSAAYAGARCEAILRASAALVTYAHGRGVDLYARLPVRRKKRPLK